MYESTNSQNLYVIIRCALFASMIVTIYHGYHNNKLYSMQVTCVTASPVLSNRERFPNYFQLLPSLVDLSPSYIGLIKELKWRHVLIYLQNENLFTSVRLTIAVMIKPFLNITCGRASFQLASTLSIVLSDCVCTKQSVITMVVSFLRCVHW